MHLYINSISNHIKQHFQYLLETNEECRWIILLGAGEGAVEKGPGAGAMVKSTPVMREVDRRRVVISITENKKVVHFHFVGL